MLHTTEAGGSLRNTIVVFSGSGRSYVSRSVNPGLCPAITAQPSRSLRLTGDISPQ